MVDGMPHLLIRWPPRFLRTPEAARFLGLSTRTLEKHRSYGTEPKYRKIGGRVISALADLKAWADLGIKKPTSDPGAGSVLPAFVLIWYSPQRRLDRARRLAFGRGAC